MTRVRLRYFASVREALGPGEDWTTEALTLGSLRDALIARGAPYAQALSRERPLRMALDQVLCDEQTAVHEGAEVAFFPPVTGG
jgi:molybdopterin synthase sulfur carrier subunit